MQPKAFYNENDRAKAAWLRHLIEEGVIAHGVVDERSITEICADDVASFTQIHWFAGIGVWSYALRRAGWPDDRPAWTGSCPCGPFSIAGKRGGFDDPRHLWPAWFRLIRECGPDVLFGEQSDQAHAWLDLVLADLEGLGYAVAAVDLPAAGFGGAHERQRYFWMADAHHAEWWSGLAPWNDGGWPKTGRHQGHGDAAAGGGLRGMVDASGPGLSDAQFGIIRCPGTADLGGATQQSGDPSGAGVDWLFCRDRRWRPVEPQPRTLADEIAADLGRMRHRRLEDLKAEVIRHAVSADTDPGEALLHLWQAHTETALSGRSSDGAEGVREAHVLLAVLRSISRQGWDFAERLRCTIAEADRQGVRVLRVDDAASRPPRGRGLDEPEGRESSDLVRLLSPILARYAQEARAQAAGSYAPACLPLVGAGDPARMGRLRGYGDAIDAEVATQFVAAYLEVAP